MAYHKLKIPKGKLGEPSKLTEELLEFIDAHNQGNKVLELCELSDLVGAINAYMKKNYPGMNLLDLHIMAEATREEFEAGRRK